MQTATSFSLALLLLTTLSGDAKAFKNSSPSYKSEKSTDSVNLPVKAGAQWEEAVPTVGTVSSGETVKSSSMLSTKLEAQFPDKEWWNQYQDSYLARYMSDALRDSPRLEASIHRIEQSRAQVMKIRSDQLPHLAFSPGYAHLGLPSLGGGGDLPSNISLFLLSFMPSYQVDLFGLNADRTRSARTELKAVEQDSRSLLLSVQGEVATAYFNLLRADYEVSSQQESLELFQKIHSLKENQHQAGLTSYDEVIRSERDVAQALTNLTNYKQQQAMFAHQLAVLTGRPPQSESHLERGKLQDFQLPSTTQMGTLDGLLTRRPDIAAQELRLKRSAIDVTVARKRFLPTIKLSAYAAWAGSTLGKTFSSDSFSNIEMAQGNQQIYEGGAWVGEKRLQRAKQKEQIANYRQTILTAMKEVEDQLSLLKTSYDALNSNSERLDLTKHSLEITQDQQNQGLIPKLNVYQAQSELLQYEQLKAQSKSDAAIATVNLYKALGGGF
jgi:multidrug efflux system outer membrane protein